MQKRFWAAGAAFFVGLAGMLLWQFVRAGAPFYHGRPLIAWLRPVHRSPPSTPEEKEAVEAIQQIGERAVPGLTHILTNTPSDLRMQARSLLWRFGIPVPPRRDDSWSAVAAFEILGPRAKSAVPPLTQALYGGKSYDMQRPSVASALGAIGPAGWEVLGEALSSTNLAVCYAAAEALDYFHVDDAATVDCLIRASSDFPDRINFYFRMLLRRTSERNRVVLFMIAELGSASVNTRKAAMEALGYLGQQSERVVPLLRPALESTNEDEMLTAVRALGQFGARAKEVEPTLLNMIQSSAEGGKVLPVPFTASWQRDPSPKVELSSRAVG